MVATNVPKGETVADVERLKAVMDHLTLGDWTEVERLNVEVKGIQGFDSRSEFMAQVAKAVMALCNYGGGVVVLGFTRNEDGQYVEEKIEPDVLSRWEQTRLHDALSRFMEPVPEVELTLMEGKISKHPVISVPPHGAVPVICTLNGEVTKAGRVYIRKPGPKSEEPLSPLEWQPLLRRCLLADKQDLVTTMRNVIQGVQLSASKETVDGFHEKVAKADRRFEELRAESTALQARKPFGRWTMAYQLLPEPTSLSLTELRRITELAQVPGMGRPIGWVVSEQDGCPRPWGSALEAWIIWGGLDYWLAEPSGFFYATRSFIEDVGILDVPSGHTVLEWNLPMWRVAEGILHAVRMASHYRIPQGQIRFLARFKGLKDRVLWNAEPTKFVGPFRDYVCHIDEWSKEIEFPYPLPPENLSDVVRSLLEHLYEQFDLFEMPYEAYSRVVTRILQAVPHS